MCTSSGKHRCPSLMISLSAILVLLSLRSLLAPLLAHEHPVTGAAALAIFFVSSPCADSANSSKKACTSSCISTATRAYRLSRQRLLQLVTHGTFSTDLIGPYSHVKFSIFIAGHEDIHRPDPRQRHQAGAYDASISVHCRPAIRTSLHRP